MTTAIDKMKKMYKESPWIGWQTVGGYWFQAWIGRARFHIFKRGPDPETGLHDHTWNFVTFPLRSYVEQVLVGNEIKHQVVPAFKFSYRPATHAHRMLGRWSGKDYETKSGWVPTFCFISKNVRDTFYIWHVRRGVAKAFEWKRYMRHALRGKE